MQKYTDKTLNDIQKKTLKEWRMDNTLKNVG